jgi:predicted DNA binding CopG/RHH family protein
MKLNKEEKEILKAYEEGHFKSVPHVKKEIKRYQRYAQVAFQKNKRINIRISERDLMHIQKKAMKEGLPYQTLISSVLHKYINDDFIEKAS